MFAIRDDRYGLHYCCARACLTLFHTGREYIQQEDLTKAARKVGEAKKHESKRLSVLPSQATGLLILTLSQPNSMYQHRPPRSFFPLLIFLPLALHCSY